jgi:hypothetical protein
MTSEKRHYRQCSPEVLRIIMYHGPVTCDMIQRMTDPPMPLKNLRQALRLLRRKSLVDMVIADRKTFFYQLHNDADSRDEVARILHCDPAHVARPLLWKRHWVHNQWCEFWALILRREFPDVEIIPEQDIRGSALARSVLLLNQNDSDLIPDFLAVFPPLDSGERVTVAFEIERTRKSDARIIKKLKKYVAESKIDGLVYVCDSGRLFETMRLLYREKALPKAGRIRGYAERFFLLSDAMSAGSRPQESFLNLHGKQVSLIDWCRLLRSTKRNLRRDRQFE